jgi:uncharacterized protein with FMN-binding domain
MKRISYWILSTLSAVVLLFGFDASRHSGTTLIPSTSSTISGTTSSGTTSSGSADGSNSGTSNSSGKTSNAKSKPKKKSVTTTVTGAVAQTQWGPVQVQLVVSNGSITKVNVLQYPNGNGRDAQINGYALPILIKETTSQQSASIDMVSGATVTSGGYLQSLQSAIDQANL